MLFGKNSDRQRNEAQNVEFVGAADYSAGEQVACAYISIPQTRHTHAALLCRPCWLWGAEMGANEHGVVIGNEGLHAQGPLPEAPALIGMDLVRLALERADSAEHAVHVITELLTQYGQGGNCGHVTPNYYHNGFMIADANTAFVLETVGKEWVCQRVRAGVRAISNGYSIRTEADRVSPGMMQLLETTGSSRQAPIDYADAIGAKNVEHIGFAVARRERSESLLKPHKGGIEIQHIMSVLRDHGVAEDSTDWQPWEARKRTLCMHAGAEGRPAQTTNAMASEIRSRDSVHWVTGTAAPCLSLFKPVLLDVGVPAHGPSAHGRFDPDSLWWRHELFHRSAMLGDFAAVLRDIRVERDALEETFRARIAAVVNGGNRSDRESVVAGCWREAIAVEKRWAERARSARSSGDEAYIAGWSAMNALAGIEITPWS